MSKILKLDKLTDELSTHEVVTRGNAAGEGEIPPPVSGDHGVYSPDTIVEALERDLGP